MVSSYLDSIDPKFICPQDSGNRRLLVAVKEDDVTSRRASYEEPASGGKTTRSDAVGRREVRERDGHTQTHYLPVCFSRVATHW